MEQHQKQFAMRYLFYYLVFFFIFPELILAKDNKIRRSITNKIHCYASNKVNKSFTPPPDEYYLKSTSENVVINVTYSDFTDQARTAFQHAVDIWSTMISSDVPINIIASWKQLDEGVLEVLQRLFL